MRSIAFTLPFALPSLNQVLSQRHWASRKDSRNDMIKQVLAAMGGSHWIPRPPFAKARVIVTRHSAGVLDDENLYGSAKRLRDVLCLHSKTHPGGLGIIEDDAPSKCELVVTQQKASRKEGFTVVRVEEIA